MEKKTRDALEKRFPDSQVKQRRGSFGKSITYVDGQAIVARLNDVFDADWNFTILEHETLETGEVLVHGRLAAFGVTKEAFGRGMPAVSKDTDEVISAVDAYKAGATDALKKCATLLGVAAYLYSDDYQEEEPPARRLVPRPINNGKSASKPTNGSRITQKQLSTIWSMGRNLGLSADGLRVRCQETFNLSPETLSRTDASSFITELGAELDENRKKQQEFNRSRGAA